MAAGDEKINYAFSGVRLSTLLTALNSGSVKPV